MSQQSNITIDKFSRDGLREVDTSKMTVAARETPSWVCEGLLAQVALKFFVHPFSHQTVVALTLEIDSIQAYFNEWIS